MRPVAAPDQSFRRGPDEGLSQRDDVGIARRAVRRVVVGHRELHPRPSLVYEPAHDRVRRMADTRSFRNMPEVIEDDRRRHAIPEGFRRSDLVGRHVDLDMPAQRRHTSCQRFDHVNRRDRGRRVGEAEADSAHAPLVQAFEFGVGHRRANNGNASGMWCEPRDGIERHAVIGDVRDWGHDDIPRGPNPSLK